MGVIRSALKRTIRRFGPTPAQTGARAAESSFTQCGGVFARTMRASAPATGAADDAHDDLRAYFDGVRTGPGVFKWLHYFEAYTRHLSKFRNQPVVVVEIGVFSGGSLPMWRQYFGSRCIVHGVDIEPACMSYANEHTIIHIGDQADREFWQQFKRTVPVVDVLIDDGGHAPEQQVVTLEEMLPHLQPGGVYICEDVHGEANEFTKYVAGFCAPLHGASISIAPNGDLSSPATGMQSCVGAVSQYPFMVVIERNGSAVERFIAERHGTNWQPFFDR